MLSKDILLDSSHANAISIFVLGMAVLFVRAITFIAEWGPFGIHSVRSVPTLPSSLSGYEVGWLRAFYVSNRSHLPMTRFFKHKYWKGEHPKCLLVKSSLREGSRFLVRGWFAVMLLQLFGRSLRGAGFWQQENSWQQSPSHDECACLFNTDNVPLAPAALCEAAAKTPGNPPASSESIFPIQRWLCIVNRVNFHVRRTVGLLYLCWEMRESVVELQVNRWHGVSNVEMSHTP